VDRTVADFRSYPGEETFDLLLAPAKHTGEWTQAQCLKAGTQVQRSLMKVANIESRRVG
jgi:hypothetical protein